MKVTMTFEISEEHAKLISECSIERVINQSVKMIEYYSDDVDTEVNLEDWKSCKTLVVNMWNGLRDGIYRVKHDEKDGDYWTV
jgi:hypothetical protein